MKLLAGRLPGPALRIRLIGAAVLVALALLIWVGAPWTERVQSAWFDAHQALWPREPQSLPVTVVAINQDSLREMGQWPWPRTQLARLIDLVAGAGAAAIGVNVLMPEADALSLEQIAAHSTVNLSLLSAALREAVPNDTRLADALARAPSVLVLAATPEPTRMTVRSPPVMVRSVHGGDTGAQPPDPGVPRHGGALTSIDQLNRHAHGWGLTSVPSRRGVIRRVPLVASIDGTLVPSLAVEMLRVAQGAPALRLALSGDAVTGLTVGRLDVPTEADGGLRVYYARHNDLRFVSAADVLKDRVDLSRLRGQLVLIGHTGLGLQEDQDTPIGVRMSGSEIHAQVLENLVDRSWLLRPGWAGALEALLLLALGGLLIWFTPRLKPFQAALLMVACVVVPMLVALAAFRTQHWLFDAALPSLSLMALFVVLLVLTLTEVTRQGKVLQRQVQAQRERNARIAGELQAARQVQSAALPSAELLAGDPRVELHATLQPAREVGGDLYDFFMLDGRRLFFLLGDVAGKGLSASIFMAVSKALYKNAMLRAPQADIGDVMQVANAEVARDNAQMLFVTTFAAILDLDSGVLDYCNAGHDNPFRLHPSYTAPLRITDGDGPPLCAVPDYPYRGARCQLLTGELLCLMTDGVTEAQTPAGDLFGHERVQRLLTDAQQRGSGPRAVVVDLQAQAQLFAEGAEPADDLTILAVRWNGPPAAGPHPP